MTSNNSGYHTFLIKDLDAYTPPRHTLTENHRLLPGEYVEDKFNVVRGQIEKGGSALPHFHKISQQFLHITSGTCEVTLGDDVVSLGAGDSIFIDTEVPHKVIVTSDDPLELINVYTPALQTGDIYEI